MVPLKTGIELVIKGEPIAMQRPRLGRVHAYNPQAELKKQTQWEIKSQWPYSVLLKPLSIWFFFYLTRDNKDIDNLVKFALDALQGVVFKNDLQVKILTAIKIKSPRGGTKIKVKET